MGSRTGPDKGQSTSCRRRREGFAPIRQSLTERSGSNAVNELKWVVANQHKRYLCSLIALIGRLPQGYLLKEPTFAVSVVCKTCR